MTFQCVVCSKSIITFNNIHRKYCKECKIKNRNEYRKNYFRSYRRKNILNYKKWRTNYYKKVCKERGLTWSKIRFGQMKINAKQRNIGFGISLFDYITIRKDWKCHYCFSTNNFSIDRKDPKLGYILENIVPCCKQCNRIKQKNIDYKQMVIIGEIIQMIREKLPQLNDSKIKLKFRLSTS